MESISFSFYQFAGTSVYLKNHGVHLMVSRVIHSLKGRKGDPQISLLYAQVYDNNWQELTNVDLVLPVRDIHGEKVMQKLSFPRFCQLHFIIIPNSLKKDGTVLKMLVCYFQ